MPIHPLPQFEADLAEFQAEEDRRAYERLAPPKTIVARFGFMKLVGEFPYDGQAKPGCGSKLVLRTFRGVELGEMLTSTCPNAGCSKSVTRKQMLDCIERSGGRDYPFFTDGRVLRIATPEDLNRQTALEASKHAIKMDARRRSERLGLLMRIVEAEPILGGERLTFYYTAEERVDFRDLVRDLAHEHKTRIEMHQVKARDEARLTADYERCGQHCCCKQFLKVLKPVSMKSAKVQKATLDPLKISGRCGRLMCCLRYEDQTYEELMKRLPRKKTRVGTPDGDGLVLDTQILTQLVLVRLEKDGTDIAVPVENLTEPAGPPPAFLPPPAGGRPASPPGGPPRAFRPGDRPAAPGARRPGDDDRPRERPPAPAQPPPAPRDRTRQDAGAEPPGRSSEIDELLADIPTDTGHDAGPPPSMGDPSRTGSEGPRRKRRRRRRRHGPGPQGPGPTGPGPTGPGSTGPSSTGPGSPGPGGGAPPAPGA